MKLGGGFTTLAAALLLAVTACVSQIDRDGTPTPAPQPTATPRPTQTVAPTVTPDSGTKLFLTVAGPQDGATVPGEAVVVYGLTLPGAGIEVDGSAAAVDKNGGFSAETDLSPGVNSIEVRAFDGQGNLESVTLSVTSLALPPQPFLLLVTEPQSQSVVNKSVLRLSGRTGPNAIASINGVSVDVDLFGSFSTMVTLEPGPNIIDVVATNNDGQVLSTVVAVIYRQADG